MKQTILEKLTQLESENDIRILLACESGSRAWGFPSPDSDYDVRFVYAHRRDWYLSVNEKPDVVELPVNAVLDINGWDLRKALRLTAKSNAVIFEWMQSPVLYRFDEQFLRRFREIAPGYFSPIAAMHHYLSMAKKKYEECTSGPDVKLKHYLYCLRAVLSALWIERQKSIPPMELEPLLTEMPDEALRKTVRSLVEAKASREESYRHPHEHALEEFLSNGIASCEAVAASLPAKKAGTDALDILLREIVTA